MRALLDKYGKDVASLVLRVGFGGFLAVNHGLSKAASWGDKHDSFPDPLGVGSTASMALTIFGELVCAALIAVGLGTRFACIPALITMLVAALVVHKSDILGDGEHALLYAIGFAAIFLVGGGKFALEQMMPALRKWA